MGNVEHHGPFARVRSKTRRKSQPSGSAERRGGAMEAATETPTTTRARRVDALILRLGVDLGQLDSRHPAYLTHAIKEFHEMAQSTDEGERAAGSTLVTAIATVEAQSGGVVGGDVYTHGVEFGEIGGRLGKALACFDPSSAAVIIRSLTKVDSLRGRDVATRAAERLVAVFRAELTAAVRRLALHDDWARLDVAAPLVLLPEPLPTGLVVEAVGLPIPRGEWRDDPWNLTPDHDEFSPEQAFDAAIGALQELAKAGLVERQREPPRWSLTDIGRHDVSVKVHRWRRAVGGSER